MYLTESQKKDYHLIKYLAEQVFSEPIISISPLSYGYISDNYKVNGHLIFKIPTQRTPLDNWNRVSHCAPAIQKQLSYQIPLPKLKPVFLNSTSQDFLLSSSYEKIEGNVVSSEDFSKQDLSFKKHFFEQLSHALIELQQIDPNSLPVKLISLKEFAQNFFSKQIELASPAQRTWAEQIFSSCLKGLEKRPQNILCHTDLRASNICIDDHSRLVGILDFDSLNRGDRFIEFRPKLYWQKKDIELFRKIYEQCSNHTIEKEEIQEMQKIYRTLYALRAVVYGLQKAEKIIQPIKHFFSKKSAR